MPLPSAYALLALLLVPVAAFASEVPPVRQAVDENGVDVIRGTFNYSLSLPSAGPSFPRGFENGTSNFGEPLGAQLTIVGSSSNGNYIVSFAGASDSFIRSGDTFANTEGNGATLQIAGGGYTYTRRDGLTIVFVPNSAFYPFYEQGPARVARIVLPDGSRISYAYKIVRYCLGGEERNFQTLSCPSGYRYALRLQSVYNNYGYQIKYSYASNALNDLYPNSSYERWSLVTSRVLVDNAVDYCDPGADTCNFSRTWPTVGVSGNVLADPLGRTFAINQTFDPTTYQRTYLGIRRPGAVADSTAVTFAAGKVSTLRIEGVVYTYSYAVDGSAVTTTVTGPDGAQKVYVSDSNLSRVISFRDELMRFTYYQYDGNGRLTRITLPEGDGFSFAYDSRGNVIQSLRFAKPGSGLADIVTSATYPTDCAAPLICNKPSTVTDPRGGVTEYSYDPTHGGVLTITGPAPAPGEARPQRRVAYAPYQAFYKANSAAITGSGFPVYLPIAVSECRSGSGCFNTAEESRSIIEYGPQADGTINRLYPVAETRMAGDGSLMSTTSFTYDAVGNMLTADGPLPGAADISRYHYDAGRRPTGAVLADPDGSGPLPHRAIRYSWNADGQVTKVEAGTVADQSDGQWAAFTPYQEVATTYDANARKVREELRSGGGGTTYQVAEMSYDARGRLDCTAVRMNEAQLASPPGPACSMGAWGSHGPDRITKNYYDAADQLTAVQVALGTTPGLEFDRQLSYTPNGQVASVLDGENNRTTYEYDGHDRLIRTRFPVPTQGAAVSSTTDVEELSLDAQGNVIQRRLRDGSVIGYAYDGLNRVTVKTLPAAEGSVFYSYDLQGRLRSAAQAWDTLTFTYDALGRQTSASNFLGTISYQYDAAGRRTRLSWPDGFSVTYDYLATGEVSTMWENGVSQLLIFGYDALGRRTSLTRGNGTVTNWSYDAGSRLTQLSHDAGGWQHDLALGFTYNPAGQIATATRSNDAYAWTGHYNVSRSYAANGLNQYTFSGSVAPTYDGRGNLTSAGGPVFGYTQEGRLATISGLGGLTYDPLGRLVVSSAQFATRFGYDGAYMIAEYNSSNQLLRRYVHGPGDDEPLVWYEGAGTGDRRFFHADERGSIIAVTDATATASAINSYDEYGIPGAANQGRFQYTGQVWLPEFGLYHYKARAYSPTLGRFLQPDPIGYDDGMNIYDYVGSDPVNGRDPTGLARDPRPSNAAITPVIPPGDIIVRCCKSSLSYIDALDLLGVRGVGGPVARSGDRSGGGSGGGTGQGAPSPPKEKEKDDNPTLEKAKRCASAELGLDDLAAAGAAVSGFSILETRGKFAGATPGTSIASRGASAIFGEARLPFQVPTLVGNPLMGSLAVRGSASVARIVGRGVPVLGWGLLVYDAAQVGQCVASDD